MRLAAPLLIAVVGCASPRVPATRERASAAARPELERSSLAAQGMRSTELIKFTTWLRDNPAFPIFSVLVSRNGKLVYELYTSAIDPDAALARMGAVTLKQVLGMAAVGIPA